MGIRQLTGFIYTGSGAEYYKSLPDLEARIRTVYQGVTELTEGSGIGSLAQGEFYPDYQNERLYIRTTDDSNPNTKNITAYTYFLVFGTWATEAEMTNLELFQAYSSSVDSYIKYIKIYIMKFGNPSFTNLKLEIHPELNDYPTEKVLITSENTFDANDITASENAMSEIWFRFNDYGVKAGEKYCLVLKATGTFTENSHLSWVKMEPIYTTGQPSTTALLGEGSYRYSIIGREI